MTIAEFLQIFPHLVTIIALLFTAISAIIVVYIKKKIDISIKKYSYVAKDLSELHRKMHDRLIETELRMKENKEIDNSLKKRLLMNASRLTVYDDYFLNSVYTLLNSWEIALELNKNNTLNDAGLSEIRTGNINLIGEIRDKVNQLIKL